MTKKFAVFDIDGTVFRWQLYHTLFDELVQLGVITKQQADPVYAARHAWKDRASDVQYHDYETLLVDVLEPLLDGMSAAVLDAAADAIIARHGHRLYTYTRRLLTELKERGYTIIAISGSHQQLVDRFSTLHGIDIARGRKYTSIDGVLRGEAELVVGKKDTILRQVVAEHNLDWEDSYAVGDTGGDIAMLALVAHPIAFNPNKELFAHATQHGWRIVIERKDVVYSLSQADGTYTLDGPQKHIV